MQLNGTRRFGLPGPRELRAWTRAAGAPEADRYLLGPDPHAPDTHSPLASALMRVGIAPTLIGTRGARPALRISGRRRLLRLVENVGEAPGEPHVAAHNFLPFRRIPFQTTAHVVRSR